MSLVTSIVWAPTFTSWKPGDRVFYHGDLSKPGGYAEFAIAPAHIITRIPDNVTFEETAAIPCAGYTAWQILSRKIPVRQGQALLVHGGAGGVGGFAIQLGRIQNLKIITTCSAANFSAVKDLGALHPIDYRSEDVTARVMEITNGRGVDIVINTIDSKLQLPKISNALLLAAILPVSRGCLISARSSLLLVPFRSTKVHWVVHTFQVTDRSCRFFSQ
jgi:NADPH:quinone reductase-like Zn-dependent oxidoreductase